MGLPVSQHDPRAQDRGFFQAIRIGQIGEDIFQSYGIRQ